MNKIGYIVVSISSLEDFWFHNKWFVPISAQVNKYEYGTITYLCYCDKFKILLTGQKIPRYNPVFKKIDSVVELVEV